LEEILERHNFEKEQANGKLKEKLGLIEEL